MNAVTSNKILFFDTVENRPIRESDLKMPVANRCPSCNAPIEIESGQLVLETKGRWSGSLKDTGQQIKKCQCKTLIKMPYRLTRT
ncbi:MAG: hypothetical protein CV087_21920 [Candidatus Brocadia sp. WS118]|nr:MAG: hypothetical protein CV087_21920 [Candidatus Brocadia sp. WS118]